jgi:hypothetical protein
MTNVAPRLCALALAAAITLCGCVHMTPGSPMRAPRSGPLGPNARMLPESTLDQLLLSVSDVSSIVGGTGLQISNSAQDLSDSSDILDRAECLGVMFAGEKHAYEGTGWKAVRDQIIGDSGDDKEHWVEQTVVQFPSWEKADNFLQNSHDEWQRCANGSVTTQGSDNIPYQWKLGQVSGPSDAEITVDMNQQNSDNWGCQHALAAVSNLIVEAVACGSGASGQGEKIVSRIVQNAASV